ncbi:hypothetical protein [Micromonospora sp. LOL_024]|uniref:hypothetical protein n=1 Tax=Micromonospora sp. LOL_024 TaxID=3345412 RepID=UPI003A8C3893
MSVCGEDLVEGGTARVSGVVADAGELDVGALPPPFGHVGGLLVADGCGAKTRSVPVIRDQTMIEPQSRWRSPSSGRCPRPWAGSWSMMVVQLPGSMHQSRRAVRRRW